MEAAHRSGLSARAGVPARPRCLRAMRREYGSDAQRQAQARLSGAPAIRRGLGTAAPFVGCRPHRAGGGRRRRMRSSQYAYALFEVPQGGHEGVGEAVARLRGRVAGRVPAHSEAAAANAALAQTGFAGQTLLGNAALRYPSGAGGRLPMEAFRNGWRNAPRWVKVRVIAQGGGVVQHGISPLTHDLYASQWIGSPCDLARGGPNPLPYGAPSGPGSVTASRTTYRAVIASQSRDGQGAVRRMDTMRLCQNEGR